MGLGCRETRGHYFVTGKIGGEVVPRKALDRTATSQAPAKILGWMKIQTQEEARTKAQTREMGVFGKTANRLANAKPGKRPEERGGRNQKRGAGKRRGLGRKNNGA